jgi:cystathionine beta-lyase family protein involved in aluminum resistance
MVGESLKGGRLVAEVMSREGYAVAPAGRVPFPPSFITAVEVGSTARMCAFCRAVQRCSPVGSYIEPIPGAAQFFDWKSIDLVGQYFGIEGPNKVEQGLCMPKYLIKVGFFGD